MSLPYQNALLAWIGLAVLLFAAAPKPPELHRDLVSERQIQQRLADLVVADAEKWREEQGDRLIPWEEASGHLAIVIDDVGRELLVFDKLLALRHRLTFSVLPRSVYVAGVQQRLQADRRRYREIMLHLPMEPLSPAVMRDGLERQEDFLLRNDSPAQLREKTLAALNRVPAAIGVNNHMGSALSAELPAMEVVMEELKARDLFFLDSRTTQKSVAYATARSSGVPALSRSVFLDHDESPEAVRSALLLAVQKSKNAPTVAIAHPKDVVVEVLREQLPKIHADGVGVYPLSEFLRRQRGAPPAPTLDPPTTTP